MCLSCSCTIYALLTKVLIARYLGKILFCFMGRDEVVVNYMQKAEVGQYLAMFS